MLYPTADPARPLQQQILDVGHDDYYGDQSKGYYGNWFNWEIGISTHLSKTLVLLEDELTGDRFWVPLQEVEEPPCPDPVA